MIVVGFRSGYHCEYCGKASGEFKPHPDTRYICEACRNIKKEIDALIDEGEK